MGKKEKFIFSHLQLLQCVYKRNEKRHKVTTVRKLITKMLLPDQEATVVLLTLVLCALFPLLCHRKLNEHEEKRREQTLCPLVYSQRKNEGRRKKTHFNWTRNKWHIQWLSEGKNKEKEINVTQQHIQLTLFQLTQMTEKCCKKAKKKNLTNVSSNFVTQKGKKKNKKK